MQLALYRYLIQQKFVARLLSRAGGSSEGGGKNPGFLYIQALRKVLSHPELILRASEDKTSGSTASILGSDDADVDMWQGVAAVIKEHGGLHDDDINAKIALSGYMSSLPSHLSFMLLFRKNRFAVSLTDQHS